MFPIHNFGSERDGVEDWYFFDTDKVEVVRYEPKIHYPTEFYCITTTESRRKTTINITLNLLKEYNMKTTLQKLMETAGQDYTDKRTTLLFMILIYREFKKYAEEN